MPSRAGMCILQRVCHREERERLSGRLAPECILCIAYKQRKKGETPPVANGRTESHAGHAGGAVIPEY